MHNSGSRTLVLGTLGLALASSFALSGCQDNSASAGPSSSTKPSSAPSAPASSAPAAAPTASSGDGGQQTPPGTLLQIGRPATVPYTSGSTKGTLAITVTAIQMGAPSDLAPLKLGDKVKGMVPYYIRYSVKNAGTTDLSFTSAGEMKGLLTDGSEAQDVDIIGSFDKCPNNSAPSGFSNGGTYTTCRLSLAPSASVKVAGAEWWGAPYTIGKGVDWGVKASS